MPNTSSATKALRQAQARTIANASFKIALKKSIKTVTKETLAKTTSLIDKAVKRHLIHRNKAARMKSQLAKAHGNPTSKRPGAGVTAAKTAKPTKVKAKITK